MASPVIIEWIVKGIPDVVRASRTVQDTVLAAERNATRAAQKESAARQKIVEQEARQKVQSWQKVDNEVKRIQERASRETQRAADAEIRSAERTAAGKLRAFERGEADKARVAARWVAQREQAEQRAMREANSSRQRFVSAIAGSAVSGVRTSAGRIAGLAGQVGGMVSQLGGGFSIADSVQRGVALKGKLADIANRDMDSTDPTKKNRKSVASIEGKVRGVSAEFGIDSDTGANALDKFASKTGELKVGMDMLRGLGELSRAGAGSMDDLADAAGDIFNSDKTQNAEAVLQKLRAFAVQGQKGAVEMKDLASQMAKIGAASGRFKDGGQASILTFGALAQLSRESGGSASASQATTAVGSLANQFYKNKRLEHMKGLMGGKSPKDDDGFNRPIEEVLFDLMRGAEKESRKKGHGLQDFDESMGTAVADAQARRATSPLEKAFKLAGGGDAGIAAAKKELGRFGAGGRDLKTEFAEKARSRTGEADAQMEIIKQKFDEAVSTKIIPALLKLVPEFEKLVPLFISMNEKAIPAFVSLLKSIGEFADANQGIITSIAAHPFAALIGAALVKSVGSELVSKMAGSALAGLLSKLGGGGGGGVPGVGGGASAAAKGLMLGAAAGGIIIDSELGAAKGEEKAADMAAKVRAYNKGDRSDRSVSPWQAMAEVDNTKKRLEAHGGLLEQTGNLVASPFSKGNADARAEYKSDQGFLDGSKELIAAIRENTLATRSANGGAGASNTAPGAPNRSEPIKSRN